MKSILSISGVNSKKGGFTIAEIAVIIVVIVILSTIVAFNYVKITRQAAEDGLKSDLFAASQQLETIFSRQGSYPVSSAALPGSIDTVSDSTFNYVSDGTAFCITGTSSDSDVPVYYVKNKGIVNKNSC